MTETAFDGPVEDGVDDEEMRNGTTIVFMQVPPQNWMVMNNFKFELKNLNWESHNEDSPNFPQPPKRSTGHDAPPAATVFPTLPPCLSSLKMPPVQLYHNRFHESIKDTNTS